MVKQNIKIVITFGVGLLIALIIAAGLVGLSSYLISYDTGVEGLNIVLRFIGNLISSFALNAIGMIILVFIVWALFYYFNKD